MAAIELKGTSGPELDTKSMTRNLARQAGGLKAEPLTAWHQLLGINWVKASVGSLAPQVYNSSRLGNYNLNGCSIVAAKHVGTQATTLAAKTRPVISVVCP